MKNSISIIMVIAVLFCFAGCGYNNIASQSGAVSEAIVDSTDTSEGIIDAYMSFIDNEIEQTEIEYAFKDIDGNGIEELLIVENTELTVYALKDSIVKIGTHDFTTGTFQLLYSNKSSYPGIIAYSVGGGVNHFAYITVDQSNSLSIEKIYDEDYSGILSEPSDGEAVIIPYTEDTALISEAETSYNDNLMFPFEEYKK